jgi:Flp pilus assembly protein TadD
MKMSRMTAFGAAAWIALALSTGAHAVDSASTKDAPELTSVRAKIAAQDYNGAIAELTPMLATYQNPDVYNLLGFSLRKTGDLKQAATFYAKALDFDPSHKPALEYQGELFLQMGDLNGAKANLTKLAGLCPSGCDEKSDLERAIADYKPAATN